MKKTVLYLLLLAMCLSIFSVTASAAAMTFTDVKTDNWFYNDVKTAFEDGLINGKSSTAFAPNDNLTYAEAVKLAACMHQKYRDGMVTLTNGDPWYQSYVDYCKKNNIISGDYTWNDPATRAGYMSIFANALPNLDAINTVEDNGIPDVQKGHPQYDAIYKLYRAGILQGVDSAHNCNPSGNIKRSEVAAILSVCDSIIPRPALPESAEFCCFYPQTSDFVRLNQKIVEKRLTKAGNHVMIFLFRLEQAMKERVPKKYRTESRRVLRGGRDFGTAIPELSVIEADRVRPLLRV